jgi:hypothetical protein
MLCVIPLLVSGQEAYDRVESLSAEEEKELIDFTKRFVAHMQRTRDVRPLLAEFFIPLKDMGELMSMMLIEDDERDPNRKPYRLDRRDGQRAAVIFYNLMYLYSVAEIMDVERNGIVILIQATCCRADRAPGFARLLTSLNRPSRPRIRRSFAGRSPRSKTT